MELTAQQVEAHEKVGAWIDRHRRGLPAPQVFRFFGAAGTGKTTIAQLLTQGMQALFASPIGKAADVMTSRGCPATTVHQLIYQPLDRGKGKLEELRREEAKILRQLEATEGPDAEVRKELRTVRDKMRMEEENLGRPYFALKSDSELREAEVLALDECSTADQVMGQDLLSFGRPILAMGDPFQLPPVRGTGFFTQDPPDMLLTEVHRHAGPILWRSADIREGRGIGVGVWEDENSRAEVMRGRPDPARVMAADQLLCGRNATRIALNKRVRDLLGRTSPLPEPGDRLVCLKNNRELGLTNGSIWVVTDTHGSHATSRIILSVRSEDGKRSLEGVVAHTYPFEGREVPRFEYRDAEQFDFGNALTVHKAIGSQWERTVLFDDWGGQDRIRWQYTGWSRAIRDQLMVQ